MFMVRVSTEVGWVRQINLAAKGWVLVSVNIG